MKNDCEWKKEYCRVYKHTSIEFLKNCPGFFEAKNGDMEQAERIIKLCANKLISSEIRHRFSNAILLPIISQNALPIALANQVGLKICASVKPIDSKKTTNIEQLCMPKFKGKVHSGKKYIVVDDIIVQGGLLSSLINYIIKNGGEVCAIVALAHEYVYRYQKSKFIYSQHKKSGKLSLVNDKQAKIS